MENKILNKAAELFLNLGVKSVTMDQIAGDLGMSKKTVYAHFATKTLLVEATAHFIFDRIAAGIESIKQEKQDPVKELFSIKDVALEHLRDEKSSPQFQLQKYYPRIFANFKVKQQNLMESYIQKNMERGITEGVYRRDLPLVFTSRMYFIGMMGTKDREVFPERDFSMHELVNQHLEYHVRAIATEKGIANLTKLLKSETIK